MKLKPRITFQDVDQSPSVEQDVLHRIDKLNQFYSHLTRCDVVIKKDLNSKQHGDLFRPSIVVSVPGEKINVHHAANEDVFIALRDAFSALQRRLKAYARKQRGRVKHHQSTLYGKIDRIFADQGYGFIVADGTDYYFSTTNVHNTDFDRLRAGMKVDFIPDINGDSLQANRINVLKRK